MRLDHMDYIGDKSVAMAISHNLEEVENELKIKNRKIVDDGYLIENINQLFDEHKFEIKWFNDEIKIVIEPRNKKESKYQFAEFNQIGFCERCQKIVFKVKPADIKTAKKFMERITGHKIKAAGFFKNKFLVLVSNKIEDDCSSYIEYSELIYYPKTIKDISKIYTIATIEFYPHSKTYDYLCLDEKIKIGEQKCISVNGEEKEVTIVGIKNVYEDQLPLPFSKIGLVE